MNDWSTIRKIAIVEADDFQDRWDRNGLNFLFYWKTKYPKFKISLFTIPNRTSPAMLNLIREHRDFIELVIHGWDHESNFECYGWNYERTTALMKRVASMGREGDNMYKPFFKAPGWTITPGYNGYPAGDRDPVKEDPQVVYRTMNDLGITVIDRHYNVPARPQESQIICIDCNPNIVHFHTWNVPSGDPNGRNGFQDVEEMFGVPWDENTEFKFISEAWSQNLFKPCSK